MSYHNYRMCVLHVITAEISLILYFYQQIARQNYTKNSRNNREANSGNGKVPFSDDYIQINSKLNATTLLGLDLLRKIQATDVLMSDLMENCQPFL